MQNSTQVLCASLKKQGINLCPYMQGALSSTQVLCPSLFQIQIQQKVALSLFCFDVEKEIYGTRDFCLHGLVASKVLYGICQQEKGSLHRGAFYVSERSIERIFSSSGFFYLLSINQPHSVLYYSLQETVGRFRFYKNFHKGQVFKFVRGLLSLCRIHHGVHQKSNQKIV